MLALVDGVAGALRNGHEDTRVLPDKPPLLLAEDPVDGGIQVVVRQGVGLDVVADQVGGIGDLGDAPARNKGNGISFSRFGEVESGVLAVQHQELWSCTKKCEDEAVTE